MVGHPDLPKQVPDFLLSKKEIFAGLKRVDGDPKARCRVLAMESDFRSNIGTHIRGLPLANSKFAKFNTNPFVLLFYSKQKAYTQVGEIEKDLVSAKVFSSMETSAGKMVEKIVLPIYGWEVVQSAMQTHESLLDGRKTCQEGEIFVGVTLKSGPKTLNDDMAKNIGTQLVERAPSWAITYMVKEIDFTYGTLYGTKKQSNKKDWHILRNIEESRPNQSVLTTSPKEAWSVAYTNGSLSVSATVRVGIEWWEFLGGKDAWIELCCALIRACIVPTNIAKPTPVFTISDLSDILDMSMIDDSYNVSILQKSQLEWLLFLARHFSDGFKELGD